MSETKKTQITDSVDKDVEDLRYLEKSGLTGDAHFHVEDMTAKALSDADYRKHLQEKYPDISERIDSAISAGKDDFKNQEAEQMRQSRITEAQAMTPEQAKDRAARDIEEHQGIDQSEAHYLRGDMAERAEANPHYKAALEAADPALAVRVASHGQDEQVIDVQANIAAAAAFAAAKDQVAADLKEHADLEKQGLGGEAFFLRQQMEERRQANPAYRDQLEDQAPKLVRQIQDETAQARNPISDGLDAEKDTRKALDAAAMQQSRIAEAQAMTPEQAKDRAARDIEEHQGLEDLGDRGQPHAHYLRGDMAERAEANPHYKAALEAADPALAVRVAGHGQDEQKIDVQANLAAHEQAQKADHAKDLQDRRRLKEQQDAAAAISQQDKPQQTRDSSTDNSFDLQATGKELGNGEFVMPRRIANNYTEVNGKFYEKDSNRVAFEDKGNKLATATVNKEAVADMVALAHAKQWSSLKLSGSQEFRREAWLQAESQGIKTVGYTPKEADLAALESLRQQRATNAITPLKEREASRDHIPTVAPRSNVQTNPASMDLEAKKSLTTNLEALRNNANLSNRSAEDLTRLAYWRGIVAEDNKHQPAAVRDEAVARFDKSAEDPKFVEKLPKENAATISDRTTERVQTREAEGHEI